jgi:5-methylcytosine-specific restriction endonuclease McrA
MKRTPLKRGNSSLKKASLNARPKIRKDKKEMKEFFLDLWNATSKGNRKCESCGKELYEPIRSYYFDHLIEKSKRPDLTLERDNIFLCCLECHALKTDGHPTEAHQKAIEKARERFGIS